MSGVYNPELMITYQSPFENDLSIVLNRISVAGLTVFRKCSLRLFIIELLIEF